MEEIKNQKIMNVYEKKMALKSDKELMEIINSDDMTIMQEALDAAKKEIECRKLNNINIEDSDENIDIESQEKMPNSISSLVGRLKGILELEKPYNKKKPTWAINSTAEKDVKIIRQWVTFFGVLTVFSLMVSLFYVVSIIL